MPAGTSRQRKPTVAAERAGAYDSSMVSAPIRRPELAELETFLLAARHGSLTAAAAELRLSKTAVAKRLRSLEALVGRRLLERGPRGTTLTEEGRRLVPEVERLLAESDRVFAGLGRLREGSDPHRISGVRQLSGAAGMSTERVLQETEHVFAAIFHAVDDAIGLFRPEDGITLEANDSFARIFGYSREDLLGTSPAELGIVPAPYLAELFANAGEAGAAAQLVETRTRTGGVRQIEFSLQRITLSGELRLLGVGRDVTERVQHERLLLKRAAQQEALARLSLAALGGESQEDLFARSAELVASHVEAAVAAVWQLSDDGVEVRSVYGAPPGPLRSAAAEPDARRRFVEIFAGRPEAVVPDIARDRRFTRKGLRALGMRSVVAVAIGSADDPYGVLAAASPQVAAFEPADVDFARSAANILALVTQSERRAEADRRRRVQLENFEALLEESRDPTVLLSLDGHYVYLNRAAQGFRGVESGVDARSVSVFDALAAASRRRLRDLVFPETERNGRWEGRFTVRRPGAEAGIPGRLTTLLVRDPVDASPRWVAAIFRPDRHR